jgi:hypothetical protein
MCEALPNNSMNLLRMAPFHSAIRSRLCLALGGTKPRYKGGTRNAGLERDTERTDVGSVGSGGGYGLFLLRTATEAAVKTSAEEAAKATIQQLSGPQNSPESFRRPGALKDRSFASRATERSGKNSDRLRFTMPRSSTRKPWAICPRS